MKWQEAITKSKHNMCERKAEGRRYILCLENDGLLKCTSSNIQFNKSSLRFKIEQQGSWVGYIDWRPI